uniref:Uncharacterized protein n=1 Tax=Anguilla anguilla TaxID=7936 RepID=A0A0E9VQ91_ANGAN
MLFYYISLIAKIG